MTQTIPEDSTLRRHFLAELQWQVRGELGPRPSDSVLVRHYDQQVESEVGRRAGSGVAAPGRAAPAGRSSSAAASAPARSAPAATAPAAAESSGGFFGWLKRLFAG